ncbi:MAG: exosortase-associated EpsI family protein [Phycisphaeraceae bacterium]|nr:exosortase-associated EpsI family protein [Phycisphaeraceae bacterium]
MSGAGNRVAFWVVCAALASAAIGLGVGVRAMGAYLRKEPVEPPRLLSEVPPESATWERRGTDVVEAPEILETLGTENYLTRTVVRKSLRPDGTPMVLQLHAAYYTGMVDTVPHVPERCFVGGGLQIGASARMLRVPLDLSPRSMLRREAEDTLIPDRTPDALAPAKGPDGAPTTYWIRLSNKYSRLGGEYIRLPFDPSDLKVRVTEFLGPGDEPFYAGYFFLANGSITSSARDVRQLAFKLTDRYAYYMKIQFTSSTVASAEELVEQIGSFLDENLGELMACAPDWIAIEESEHQS